MKIETEFKDGKWYKNISPSFDKCILQYNSKDKDNCNGYWRGYWGTGYSFTISDDYVLSTKEDLAALGTEWEEYWVEEVAEFKPTHEVIGISGHDFRIGDKVALYLDTDTDCKLYINYHGDTTFIANYNLKLIQTTYTIKDLSEGRVAVINDGSVEDMVSLLAVAFPNYDVLTLLEVRDYINLCSKEFYYLSAHYEGAWVSYIKTDLPKQSVKVFLEELKAESPLVAKFMEELDQVPYMREFGTGATRNTDDGKLDFEGFLSPLALEEFAKYMHTNRIQADGKLRDSDNWQKGIPMEAYMKSMYRHFFDTWKSYRGLETPEEQITNLCGLMFNVQGMLHELLKKK